MDYDGFFDDKTSLLDLQVQKYGRTTGWTQGQVAEINLTVDVCYETRGPFRCVKLARFVDQIGITDGTFSDGGDSGSLIVTSDGTNNPVGLLFAGSNTRTLANRIDLILARFNVDVDGSETTVPDNYPPIADFSFTTTDLTAYFIDLSDDSDGSVVDWDWDFGDGNTSTAQNPSNTYASGGTYSVTLIVTDDDGATESITQDVTVSDGSGGITLTATGKQNKRWFIVDLDWSGATSTDVDIYRDGATIVTTSNDGAYTDKISNNGSGSYIYQVCEAGTSTCSNETTVTFN